MSVFFDKPNLPDKNASVFIMSDRKKEYSDALHRLTGAEVFTTAPVSSITGEERYHADMSIIHIGGKKFISVPENSGLNSTLTEHGAELYLCSGITAASPKLNAFILGNKLICCKKTVSEILSGHCKNNNIEILHTNQRYAKCSSAIINDNALITSDESIYKLCVMNDIDVLKISAGHIMLDGYDYGFIGGCCGKISSGAIAFCGDLKTHPDSDNICGFLGNYGIKAVSLGSGQLYDTGGILPIA